MAYGEGDLIGEGLVEFQHLLTEEIGDVHFIEANRGKIPRIDNSQCPFNNVDNRFF